MRAIKRRVVAGLTVAALVVGAGGFAYLNRSPEDAYTDVDELVADLESNGVECKDLIVSPPDQTGAVGGEFGFCYIGPRNVNIHVYDDPERVPGHVASNKSVRGDDPNYFTSTVYGSNWVVDTYSVRTSRAVQEAIGGAVE